MLQKMELQQLLGLSLEEAKACKEGATERKLELEGLKASGDNTWTPELQEELDELNSLLKAISSVIAKKAVVTSDYVVKPGTESLVHLSIVRGRRFNSMTGKEESPAYVQMFTFAEWQLFKEAYQGLGYTIMKVLHDPYGEATKLVQSN